jgi:dCMP deaminase
MVSDKDKKFMQWCIDGARIFSTCEKRQYMSIIVDVNGKVESTGYNGAPAGFEHCISGCPRFVNNVPPDTDYDSGPGLCYAIHSEINCLLHSDVSKRRHGTMYVNGVPCFGCAKTIANSGLDRLVFLNEQSYRVGNPEVWKLFEKTSIELVEIKPEEL